MTFLEAAIEVLRREGKPLPVRRLAELAVQHNLLSVVGRDPEGTMNARLAEVLDKGPAHGELLRVPPDLFGLRVYPERPYPVPREGGEPEVELEGEDEGVDTIEAGSGGAPSAAVPGRRRRRRGRGGRSGGAEANGTHRHPQGAQASQPAEAASPDQQSLPLEAGDMDEAGMEAGGDEPQEFDVEADGASAAPLMISTAGDEELTRSGEEREVRSEILGRRDERGRGRRHDRGGRKEHAARRDGGASREGRAAHAQGHGQQAPVAPRPAAPTPAPAATGERKNLGSELVEILRGQDGRPQHARALAQEVERRKILEGRPQPEIVRETRMALLGELSSRPARGLRARIRSLGGGNYGSVDRKLDEELLAAERSVEQALDRLTTATNAAVRRKLSRLSPFSFEQLGRLVAESLGVERPTLVKRGDGVAYFGGERQIGAIRSRVLVGIRSGEAELGRRAVGELRAGLDARGFDEGFLVALGRLSAEGREELRAGRAVTVYDGDSIAALLNEKRLGVRVTYAPIAYFDPDFFAELNET
jgi:hypothetical protein